MEPPKIDKRTYEEIVTQTEAIAGRMTCVVQPTIAALLGRTLAEDIQEKTQTIAQSGTVIDEDLAQKISLLPGLQQVRVVGWQGVKEVTPSPEKLVGRILMQNVIQSVPPTPLALVGQTLAQDIQQRAIATRGTVVDAGLAQRISQVPGLPSVDVILAPRGTVIDTDLAQKISQLPDLRGVQVREKGAIQTDAGRALIRIFGRMAVLVSDRLNRTAEKNFLAFLDLIGTQIHPPQPARVPLTFTLVENSPVDAFVPAGTQIAAPAMEGEDEVVFELENELVVTRSQLQAVFVRQPGVDCYRDNTAAAQGEISADYPAFVADQPIAHHLYLSCDELLTLPGEKTVTVTVQSTAAIGLLQLPITWSAWDGEANQWKTLKGIQSGLTVKLDPYLPEITVLPGTAINREDQIQTLTLTSAQTLSLRDFRNRTVLVLLAPDSTGAKIVLQGAEAAVFDRKTQICLACLSVSRQGILSHASWSTLKSGSNSWVMPLKQVAPLSLASLNGQTAAWLCARLETPLPPDASALPQIDKVSLSVEISRTGAVPDIALRNTVPLDISKAFFPFGEQPAFNDTFYLANAAAFSQPGATVTMSITLVSDRPVDSGDPELVWEIWTGSRWEELGRSTKGNSNLKSNPNFSDGSLALTRGVNTTVDKPPTGGTAPFNEEVGKVKFRIPAAIAATTLGGEENYWLRVHISKGNYGEAAKSVKRGEKDGFPIYELVPASFSPPVVESIALSYTFSQTSQTPQILTYNDFTYASPPSPTAAFRPFTLPADRQTSLYLGFDQPFPNRPMTLYLQVEPLEPGKLTGQSTRILASAEAAKGQNKVRVEQVQGFQLGQAIRIAPGSGVQEDHEILAIQPDPTSTAGELTLRSNLAYTQTAATRIERIPSPPRLVWEYASPSGWKSLSAIDETELLRERGLVHFIGATDQVARSEFGQLRYWLRLRWDGGEFLVQPRLRRVLTNTTWAAQVVTLTDEVLGSSTGNPNQRFFASQYPVLPGQILEVREDLSPVEQEALAADSTLLNILRDESGTVEAIWVRWQEISDFYGSGMNDRHYVLDRLTGEVQFGDGQRGKVPPLGRQNLRLRQYRTGGGEQGNTPAGAIAQLKTTLPYISAAVNLEPASGAADQESLDRVKERGPKQLRHRGRAVTSQDIEDLAFEASPDVARARAISPAFSDALDWLPTYHLLNPAPGTLEVQLNWTEDSRVPDLLLSLYGPGQATPRLQQRLPRNSRIAIPLNPESIGSNPASNPTPWRVSIINPYAVDATDASGLLTYPGRSDTGTSAQPINRSQSIEFSRLSSRPHSQVVDAGRVDLIIVPRSLENQPTPSLGLLNRVENYLRERCLPTLALHITEPDWVEVTVQATLIPTSFQGADATRERALRSLTRFLHPLTGGTAGQGWDFGRQPRQSDIYALLESVAGVDFVKDLTLTVSPTIRTETPRNFLIYSGIHFLQLQLS